MKCDQPLNTLPAILYGIPIETLGYLFKSMPRQTNGSPTAMLVPFPFLTLNSSTSDQDRTHVSSNLLHSSLANENTALIVNKLFKVLSKYLLYFITCVNAAKLQ